MPQSHASAPAGSRAALDRRRLPGRRPAPATDAQPTTALPGADQRRERDEHRGDVRAARPSPRWFRGWRRRSRWRRRCCTRSPSTPADAGVSVSGTSSFDTSSARRARLMRHAAARCPPTSGTNGPATRCRRRARPRDVREAGGHHAHRLRPRRGGDERADDEQRLGLPDEHAPRWSCLGALVHIVRLISHASMHDVPHHANVVSDGGEAGEDDRGQDEEREVADRPRVADDARRRPAPSRPPRPAPTPEPGLLARSPKTIRAPARVTSSSR